MATDIGNRIEFRPKISAVKYQSKEKQRTKLFSERNRAQERKNIGEIELSINAVCINSLNIISYFHSHCYYYFYEYYYFQYFIMFYNK